MEIVGLARNARYDDLTGEFPAVVYLPAEQNPSVPVDGMAFFLRTEDNPSQYAGVVRELVRQADPRMPVEGLSTQSAQIENEMVPEMIFARLSTVFAILSLTIACVGLYGTTSYSVARRTSEIGIRMAFGARREAVVRMVLRDVVMLAVVGLAFGLPAALAASRVLESQLFGIKPGDPRALASAMAILLAAAFAAGYLPARKASRTDPMSAVRHE
jgi:macrolide transport system ATP-binding/permease protein